jgi:Tol biopolymer transport system component
MRTRRRTTVALDERLRRAIEHAGEPADPSGVYENLIGRRERRRLVRLTKKAGLALGVVLGVVLTVLGLSRVFAPSSPQMGGGATNGRIAFANFEPEYAIPEITAAWYIYTMEPDGTDVVFVGPRAVDEALYPTYSPDGRQIAFAGFIAEPEERALFVLDVATGSLSKILTLDKRHQIDGLAWSPGGSRIGILYTELVPTEPPLEGGTRGVDFFSTIWTIAPDGADMRQVTTVGREQGFSWSPDGTRIAFSRYDSIDPGEQDVADDIYVIDVDGTNETRVTRDGRSKSPAWSPEGTLLVFESHEPDESSGIDLWVMDADGSNRRRLTSDPGNEFDPTWSPDGEQIAFGERAIVEGGSECYVSQIALDGSHRERVFGMPDEEGCPGQFGISWAPAAPLSDTGSLPTPSTSPSEPPTPEVSPSIDTSGSLGLGFPVCNVSSIKGRFASHNANATLSVATKAGDLGGCPQPEEAFNVVALDTDQDGVADASFGPIECTLECRAFSAPDIDGDGTDEALVVQDGGAVVRLRLYDIVAPGGELEIVPVDVAYPGDPQSGLLPGEQASFLLGGDEFELYTLRCEEIPLPWGLGLVATSAEARPHDSTGAEWHAHQTTSVLRSDRLLHVLDVRDFTEPVTDDPGGPSFASGETLCGSNLGPPMPTP